MSEPRWDVPATWLWTIAGEISDVVGGGTPTSSDPTNFCTDGYPWLTPADLTCYSDTYIGKGRRDLTEKGLRSCGATLMPKGTVLFSSRAPVGYCAIASNQLCTNQGFKSLVLRGNIQPEFVRYYLLGSKDYAESLASGTTFKELSGARTAQILVPIAPLLEQRRIVKKLDTLRARSTRARHELDLVPKLIESYKQAILAKAFSGELTATWRATNAAGISSAAEFVADRQRVIPTVAAEAGRGRDEKTALLATDPDLRTQLRATAADHELPGTWAWAGLGQVFGIYVGSTPSRKEAAYWGGNFNWVSSGEVAFCRIASTEEQITEGGLNNASTRIHPPGTVLLGMIGEGKTRGQAAILDVPACNNQNCAAVRVSEAGYPPEYVYWYLYLAYEKTRTSGAGNNQPALNKDRVQRLPIPIAPPDEAAQVVAAIETAFVWIERIERECSLAERLLPNLHQAILAKAFRGELVPQDPNDEPASVLLERIKAERR